MTQTIDAPPKNGNGSANLPALAPPRLPYHPAVEERFGVDRASWKALVEAIFPNATSTESVILALSYCRARKLDPFKRNVHIVPIWNKQLGGMVDTIWPGIGELRTTAFRTGEYAGREACAFGPVLTQKVGKIELTFPEWAQVTVYRLVKGQRVAFAGPQVYWLETYSTASRQDDSPNEMWATRTRGQIEKCAEAAALRAAFPEEVGSDYIGDEAGHIMGRATDVGGTTVMEAPQRGVKGLMARVESVTSRPVSENQTFEPDPAALQQAEVDRQRIAEAEQHRLAEAERILREKSPSAQTVEPDVGTPNQIAPEQETDAGNKAAGPDLSTWERFIAAANEAAMDANVSEADLLKWIDKKLRLVGKFKKEEQTTADWRAAAIAKIKAGTLD